MDLKVVKEEALEETARFFRDKGFLPEQDSEEWEDAYRRQFELAKQRHATQRPQERAAPVAAMQEPQHELLPLRGAPAEARWAHALRPERLKQIQDKDVRAWLVGAWTMAKPWIDTRELPAASFLRRVEAEYADHRRRSGVQAGTAEREQKAKAEARAALQRRLAASGITATGLIELVDLSTRTAASALKLKLADVTANGRTLRIFEAANPAALIVLEKAESGRSEYAIERDEGLVADLKLYSECTA